MSAAEHSAIPNRALTIIRNVAAEYGVTAADLIGPKLARRYSRPRQEAMRACRLMTWADGKPPSYPLIGRWFRRDHTTVVYACAGLDLTDPQAELFGVSEWSGAQ